MCTDPDWIRIHLVPRLQIWNREASETLKKGVEGPEASRI
jgi:hypothetical protein